jgi:hypothetical protein
MKGKNRREGKKRRRKTPALAIFALSLVMIFSIGASGFSSYNQKLPDHGDNFSCATCHSGGNLNGYGLDFKANDKKCDDALAERDSDGDGFTNKEELDSEPPTNPGDADSYPGGNTTTNETVVLPDTSAKLGPLDMKMIVPLFFSIMLVVVLGTLIGLVVAEVAVNVKHRLVKNNRRPK